MAQCPEACKWCKNLYLWKCTGTFCDVDPYVECDQFEEVSAKWLEEHTQTTHTSR